MKPYQELTPKGKTIRMTIAHIIIYGSLLLGLYYACSRLNKTVKAPEPSIKDKSLPVAAKW